MLGIIIGIVVVLVIVGMVALYAGLDRSQKQRRDAAGLGEADHLREGDGTVGETIKDATDQD